MENLDNGDEKLQRTPIGRFGIVLPPKARETIESRKLTLYIQQRLNWVEDGLMTFIKQAMSDTGRLSDYLRLVYPADMPSDTRRNDTGGERKPLKFRFRYMLRSLEVVSRHYKDFVQWRFSGFEFTMEAFCEIVRQVFGQGIGDRAMDFHNHFRSIWRAVNPSLWCESDVTAEIKRLVDEVDELFDVMLVKCVAMETVRGEFGEAAAALRESADENRRAARENAKSARIVARVAGLSAARVAATEDATSRKAGLEKFNAAQRREVEVAIKASHDGYVLTKGGARNLSSLAEKCWRENAEDFIALASLPNDPGFKDVKSYKTALYRLHKKYPAADHFVWKA